MGKTIFAAVVAAILASVVTTLVMSSLQSDQHAADAAAKVTADETAKVERERIERRLADVEKRAAAAARAERRVPVGENVSAGPKDATALAPDGTPYVSRAELEKALGGRAPRVELDAAAPTAHTLQPTPKKTLEKIAADMNLSAGEEANLRNILRESEEEAVHSLFGDKPLDEIKREFLDAKEDPEKKAALAQGMIQNGLQNAGKLMTAEARVKRRVQSVLGEDRASKFLAAPRKSTLDPEFEEMMKNYFR